MSPPPLSPNDISQRSLKLFNPNFKSPRPVRQPNKPSLAWSSLPPPAAEIDERPKFRVRRFRLWREVTPELRRVVLDQRERFHLRRYQSYAVPSALSGQRRLFPRDATLRPNDDEDADEWTWSSPYRIRPKSGRLAVDGGSDHPLVGVGGLLTPPSSASGSTTLSKTEEEEVSKVSEVDLPPAPEIQISDRPPEGTLHEDELTSNDTPELLLLTPFKDQHGRGLGPDLPPSTYWLPDSPPSNKLPWLDKSIHKKTRKMNYQKLLEHKWILDQEHERRFRVGMRGLMADIMVWQEDKTIPYHEWKKGRKWKDTVDLKEIEDTTEFFRKIRKKSNNVFLYLDPREITHVPFRERVHELVKVEEDRKKRKKARKERKKREQEQQQEEERRKEELKGEERDESSVTADDTSPIDLTSNFPADADTATTATEEDGVKEAENMISDLRLFDKPEVQDGSIAPEQARELSDLLGRLRLLREKKTQLAALLDERDMYRQEEETPLSLEREEVLPYSQTIMDNQNHENQARADQEGSQRHLDLQREQGPKWQSAKSTQSVPLDTEHTSKSESEMDQMQIRYGSLNLDDDTALPLQSSDRHEVSSSAFSRREIEVDLSDESHSQSSSFDGEDESVKIDVHEADDEDTLTPSASMGGDEQRDTQFSGIEGSLTSHITLV